jgi:hypothetical protein
MATIQTIAKTEQADEHNILVLRHRRAVRTRETKEVTGQDLT